jgi:outer membrane protein TolC
MVQIWAIPIVRPWAVGDAQMIMIGLGQTFPAPGARGAREEARMKEADMERAQALDRARLVTRDVDHAFADYLEATARHRVHLEHKAIAQRMLDLASAKHAGGGPLTDVAQAEVELARMEADVVTDGTRIDGARARLNVLLQREPNAPLGPPADRGAQTIAWGLPELLAKARLTRPEIKAALAQAEAKSLETRALEKESSWPSFSLAALYFAPTSTMQHHGYGFNASMSLPWLWGEAAAKRDAQRESASAARTEAMAAKLPIDAEVAAAEANVRAAALRLQALRDRALAASKRAFEVAFTGYESSRTDAGALLIARRAVVDVETEMIMARATLDHALADLDAAVGAEVPRKPLTGGSHEPH